MSPVLDIKVKAAQYINTSNSINQEFIIIPREIFKTEEKFHKTEEKYHIQGDPKKRLRC